MGVRTACSSATYFRTIPRRVVRRDRVIHTQIHTQERTVNMLQTPLNRTDEPQDRYAGSWPLRRRFLDHTPPAADIADALAAGVALDPDWLREIGAMQPGEDGAE